MEYELSVKQGSMFCNYNIDEITRDNLLKLLSCNYSMVDTINFYTLEGCFVFLNMKSVDGITIIERKKDND